MASFDDDESVINFLVSKGCRREDLLHILKLVRNPIWAQSDGLVRGARLTAPALTKLSLETIAFGHLVDAFLKSTQGFWLRFTQPGRVDEVNSLLHAVQKFATLVEEVRNEKRILGRTAPFGGLAQGVLLAYVELRTDKRLPREEQDFSVGQLLNKTGEAIAKFRHRHQPLIARCREQMPTLLPAPDDRVH